LRIPFFHYTNLDSLPAIVQDGRVISRYWLGTYGKKFCEISIDEKQPVRKERGLLQYVPLFAGFYTLYRGSEFNNYLDRHYDDPKVQNKSFYGALHKTLRNKMAQDYEKVIILLINDNLIYNLADQGKIRFFSDIAVKPGIKEVPIRNRDQLIEALGKHISDHNISGELDLLDDGKTSIKCTGDIEAVIVDNDKIREKVSLILSKCQVAPELFVSNLPRE
jgi:hypothetical protein